MNKSVSKTKSTPAKSPYLVSDRAYRQIMSSAIELLGLKLASRFCFCEVIYLVDLYMKNQKLYQDESRKITPESFPYLVELLEMANKAIRRSKIARAAAARRKARKEGTELPPEDTAPADGTPDPNSDVRYLLQHTGHDIEGEENIIYRPGYYEIACHLDRGRT